MTFDEARTKAQRLANIKQEAHAVVTMDDDGDGDRIIRVVSESAIDSPAFTEWDAKVQEWVQPKPCRIWVNTELRQNPGEEIKTEIVTVWSMDDAWQIARDFMDKHKDADWSAAEVSHTTNPY